jgi:hypothetical protein
MTAPFKTWTVLPHGELTAVGDNILTVVGDIPMPLGDFPRRMTVVRLNDRRLVIYSAVSLEEDEMARLQAYGTLAFMIVPNERHRLDAGPWKDRYPQMVVVAPPGARKKVEQAAPVDATAVDFGDPDVSFVEVPGTHGTEAALEVRGADGLTLVVNEIIGAIHGAHGLRGWLLKLMGFAGEEAQIPAPVKMQFADGRAALAGQLRRWAQVPDLKRIIVSHGDIIETDPAGVLTRLADSLD